jgi:hypothetical protein
MTEFTIGGQNAGVIQNVGGDLTMGDVTVAASWDPAAVRRELEQLGAEAARVPLPETARVAVDEALAEAAAESTKKAPDRGRIAQLVQRATEILGQAGALAEAGSGLVKSLQQTATVLGPAGKALLALLPIL